MSNELNDIFSQFKENIKEHPVEGIRSDNIRAAFIVEDDEGANLTLMPLAGPLTKKQIRGIQYSLSCLLSELFLVKPEWE
jgi:hypothetical protein